jgi:signal transduction histidine kinase/sugar lactone lactonase YvrE
LKDTPPASVNSACPLNDGTLSICRNDGLFLINDGNVKKISNEDGLPSSQIVAHYRDHQHNHWIVDHHGDLHRISSVDVTIYSVHKYRSLRDLQQVIESPDGSLYAISASEIFTLRDGRLRPLPVSRRPQSPYIEIALDPLGNLAVATSTQLYIYDENSQTLRPIIEPGTPHVGRQVFSSSGDALWALFQNRLHKWDGQSLTSRHDHNYSNTLFLDAEPNGVQHIGMWASMNTLAPWGNRVYLRTLIYQNELSESTTIKKQNQYQASIPDTFLQDELAAIAGARGPDGAYWIGTFNSGIIRIQETSDPVETADRAKVYDTRNGLPSDRVNSLTIAPDGTLYFALEGAAARVTSRGLEPLDIELPPEASLTAIVRDGEGRTYIATSKGLLITTGSKQLRLDRSTGLTETGISDIHLMQDGRLLAVQQRSFFILDPESLDELDFTPAAAILHSLKSDSITLKIERSLSLPLRHRSLSGEFTLTDYFNENLHRFSWRLLPLEKEWRAPVKEQSFLYSRLDPGTYTLQFRATNGVDQTMMSSQEIEISIPPLFYETGLFQATIALAAGVLLVGLMLLLLQRQRRRQDRQLAVELEKLQVVNQLASTVAHEFNNPLQVIQGAHFMLEREDLSEEERQHYLDLIPAYIVRMKKLISRLLGMTQLREVDYASGMKILDLDSIPDSSSGDENSSETPDGNQP